MAPAAGFVRIFDSEALVPENWRAQRSDGFRVFNPTLLRRNDGNFLMAYRVVSQALGRKIAMCLLDEQLGLIRESVSPFSDLIGLDTTRFTSATRTWHADPRFVRLDDRDFIYWNDGFKKPHNNQFVMQFDRHDLVSLGEPLLLNLVGERRAIEKNWGLFHHSGWKALYSSNPFRLAALDRRSDGEVLFRDHLASDAHVATSELGELRGGAPPVRLGDEYYAFCHAVSWRQASLRSYDAAVYTFSADLSGGPRRMALRRLDLPNPFGADTLYPKLNRKAGEVVYVCGAVPLPQGWLLSYGINDERCALHLLSYETVAAHMTAA